jgi:hypothetical protein
VLYYFLSGRRDVLVPSSSLGRKFTKLESSEKKGGLKFQDLYNAPQESSLDAVNAPINKIEYFSWG